MRAILILAAMLIVFGTSMAKVADTMTGERAQAKSADKTTHKASDKTADNARARNAFAAMQPPPRTLATTGRSVTVPRDRRGHFQTEGSVDGRRLDFMVDTGASVIALNESSAARVGVYPHPDDYTANVSTANGSVKAARTRLRRVSIGGLEVRDVDALVLPDTALSENLLGLSFLSKLKRYEFTGGKLVMEQ
jgi:aspartyl protease family protein